jgi:hypothetical protein
VSHRTHRDRIEEAAEIIRSAALELEREPVEALEADSASAD